MTILTFAAGTWISKKTKFAICNPLLLSSVFVIILLQTFQIPYADYKSSSAIVNFLLFPATVSLAIPLYEKWQLLKDNLAAILAGLTAGVLTSLFSIFVIAKLLRLQKEHYVTLLPKSVTTAIGMDVADVLGGSSVLAAAVIVLTGIAGNMMAQFVCQIFKITNPIAKGIGIGSASHAIGTSKALEMGEIEGAMSSLAIAVAGIFTAFLAPIFAGFM